MPTTLHFIDSVAESKVVLLFFLLAITKRVSVLVCLAPAPAASNKSKPPKRKLTQKQPEVEEKKSSGIHLRFALPCSLNG